MRCSASLVSVALVVGGLTAGCFGSSSNGGGDGGAQDAGFDVQVPVPEGGGAEAGPEAGGGDAGAGCPTPTGAGTTHGGSITASESWTAAASPHVIPGDFTSRPAPRSRSSRARS